MKKFLISLALIGTVAGCTPVISAKSPAQVIVNNCLLSNQAEALALAQKHCEGYSKNAVKQPDDRPDGLCGYECKNK